VVVLSGLEAMLWWLAESTILASILAGLVALICRCFRPRPAVRHALWLVVLIKLLTPPLIHWPWPMTGLWTNVNQKEVSDSPPDSFSDSTQPIAANELPDQTSEIIFVPAEMASESFSADGEPRNFEVENFEAARAPEPTVETATGELVNGQWWFLPSPSQVLQVWLVGAVAMGVWQLLKILRFQRLLADGKAAPDRLVNLVAELAARLQARPPETIISSAIGSPLVWSLGRARLLFPEELLERLSDESRRSVLLHELAHLRRRDHWVGWLQLAGGCIWWWNPLFWLVCRRVRENAELACDAWVVELLPEARRAYAEALIQVTEVISQRAAPVAAFGLGHGRRREFERRLTMIMKECVPCQVPVRALVVIGLLALAVMPGWTLGQQAPLKETKPATTAPPASTPEQPAPPVRLLVTPQAPENVAPLPTPAPLISPAPVAVPPGFVYEPVTRDGVTFYQAVPAPADQGSDRLEQIEKQLQGLLKEVQAMRKGAKPLNAPAGTALRSTSGPLPEAPRSNAPQPSRVRVIREGNPLRETAIIDTATSSPIIEGGEVTLTRATYNLPNAKAEALAALLKDLKNEDIEIKVEGNKITVTTSHENQRLIAPFIGLLNGQKPRHLIPVYTAPQAAPALR
jgi:beta-lactamase regulating signal transducer with metallopeptidase domain